MPPRSDPALGQGHSIYTENPPRLGPRAFYLHRESPPRLGPRAFYLHRESPPCLGPRAFYLHRPCRFLKTWPRSGPVDTKHPEARSSPWETQRYFFPIRDRATPGNSRHLQVVRRRQAQCDGSSMAS